MQQTAKQHVQKSRAAAYGATHPVQLCVGVRCLLATLKQEAVAGAQRQRGNLRQGVRARLKDDQQDANRRGDLVEDQTLGDLRAQQGAGTVSHR